MKKYLLAVSVAALFSVHSVGLSSVYASNSTNEEKREVQLSEEQKQELSGMHKELLEKRKEIILKYVEYGVFTEEKGERIITHLEKHYEKLQENEFIPKWDGHQKGHGKHHQ